MPKEKIPQHPLLNHQQQEVRFDIQDWGAPSNYDFLSAHRHHFYEILVFEKGKAQHDIDFSTHHAVAGTVHFVASENVHVLVRAKDSQGFSIVFTPDYFDAALLGSLPFNSASPAIQLSRPAFGKVLQVVRLLREEFSQSATQSGPLIHALATSLLLLLAKGSAGAQTTTPATHAGDHLQRFRQLVKEKYKSHLTVAEYAGIIGLTPKHLIELCKAQTGQTPLKIIREQVVSEAKRLFYHTRLSVKEVAYELGFDDPASFSKYFKLATGHAPALYRKAAR